MNPSNGARPTCAADVCTYCWAEDFGAGKLTAQQVKGVLASLVKKGLIRVQDWDDRDTVVDFTMSGFAVWLAHFPEDGEEYAKQATERCNNKLTKAAKRPSPAAKGAAAAKADDVAREALAKAARPGTKLAKVAELMLRPGGATSKELINGAGDLGGWWVEAVKIAARVGGNARKTRDGRRMRYSIIVAAE